MSKQNCNLSRTKNAISARRLTQDEFIRRCVEKHGYAYNYSLVDFQGTQKKVTIICNKCKKEIEQLASNHMRGARCAHCYGSVKLTQEDFIRRSIAAHGCRYDYSKSTYKNNRLKVVITCSIHGDFEQCPDSHWKGHGCEKCAATERGESQRFSFDEFVANCNQAHNDKYEYSKDGYQKTDDLISIRCPLHGWFQQIAKAHMHGKGCRRCGFEGSGFDRSRFKRVCKKNNGGNGVFYVIKCKKDKEVFFKIGITSRSIEERYKSKGHIPYDYEALYSITDNSDYIHKLEVRIHALLKKHHYTPSLNFKGSVYECFTVIKPVEKLLEELSTTEQLQLLA